MARLRSSDQSARRKRAEAAGTGRLRAAVRRGLIGRDAALAELRTRLSARAPSVGVITGPAGVGKTALAEALVDARSEALVDARSEALVDARSEALVDARSEAPVDAQRKTRVDAREPAVGGDLVFVELDDATASLEPSACADARHIVLIARAPTLAHQVARRLGAATPWHLALGPLEIDAATRLAEQLGVATADASDVAERAGGFPRLIAIEAAQRVTHAPSALSAAPRDAWRAPDADPAWLAAAIVRRLSETLLSAMLDDAHTRESAAAQSAFDALRTHVPLCVHDGRLALPETLRALALDELRIRAAERRTRWARRAQDVLLAQLEDAAHDEVPSLVADLLYACRFEPHAASLIETRRPLRVHVDASASVRARALAATERFEGRASARLLDAWWTQDEVSIVETRTPEGHPQGFALNVTLHPESRARVDDPVVAALCAAVREQGPPLAPTERVVIGRFWADYEHHQRVKPTAAQWAALIATEAVVSASVHRDAAHWRAASERPFVELASAAVDGVSYGVFGLDRRRESPAAPFARLVATCRGGGRSSVDDDTYATPQSESIPARSESPAPSDDTHSPTRDSTRELALLDAVALADSVRDALRNVYRADRLAQSPLLDWHLMRATDRDVGKPPVARLIARLSEQVERLGADGHDGVLARTLRVTYFCPPRKGVAVAEALGMGHSTYRRWLRTAVERLTEQLVAEERALRTQR